MPSPPDPPDTSGTEWLMDGPNVSSISMSSTRFDNLLQQHQQHPQPQKETSGSNSSGNSHDDHDNIKIPNHGEEYREYYNSSLEIPIVNCSTTAEELNANELHDSNLQSTAEGTTAANTAGDMNRSLCWRSDPARSLSDWQLQIFNRSTRNFETYFVHKVVLAVGPRSCGYFQNAFRQNLRHQKNHHQSQTKKETTPSSSSLAFPENHTSRVLLIHQACVWVPHFLDFVYGKESFVLAQENAVGLLYLADFFQNPSLHQFVMEFISEDLAISSPTCRSSLPVYYVDAVYYDSNDLLDKTILMACARELPAMIHDQYPYSGILKELSPTHFSQVVTNFPEELDDTTSSSSAILLTRLITKYCSLHQAELSKEQFVSFISRISVLDSLSALTMLETSLAFDVVAFQNEQQHNNVIQLASNVSPSSELVLFQRECVGTLSEDWEQLLDNDQQRITRIMHSLSLQKEHENVLVDWFQKTLIRASNQLLEERHEKDNLQKAYDALQDEHKLVIQDLEFAHSKYASLQRNYTTNKSEMKTQISSWVKKNEGQSLERQADEEQWNLDRSRWEMDRQKWEYEKLELHLRVQQLEEELTLAEQQHQSQPQAAQQATNSRRFNRALPSHLDNTMSTSTEPTIENDSMSEHELVGYETYYPLTNGFHPQFRLF
jgi:hypothetical protein